MERTPTRVSTTSSAGWSPPSWTTSTGSSRTGPSSRTCGSCWEDERVRGIFRGIFFGEDDAAAVVARLRSSGYDAHVERERLSGEDDDEDHPWAVLTDAPELVLELLVDEYDGWLDAAEEPPAVAPLELPTAPRKI